MNGITTLNDIRNWMFEYDIIEPSEYIQDIAIKFLISNYKDLNGMLWMVDSMK